MSQHELYAALDAIKRCMTVYDLGMVDDVRAAIRPHMEAAIEEASATLKAEIEALRSTVKEYCDSDEVSADFGSGCHSSQYINEIRRRHGLIDEPKDGAS